MTDEPSIPAYRVNHWPVRSPHRRPTSPGELLFHEWMVVLNLTPAEMAERVGLTTEDLGDVFSGRQAVTADIAQKIGSGLDMSPDFFLRLQADCDAWQARVTAPEEPSNVV